MAKKHLMAFWHVAFLCYDVQSYSRQERDPYFTTGEVPQVSAMEEAVGIEQAQAFTTVLSNRIL